MNLMNIGLRIKHCRKLKRLTQEEFSEIIDLSPHYIYEIERGSKAMSLPTLGKILETLDVSADYLLYGEDFPDKGGPPSDRLSLLIEELTPQRRDNLADIVTAMLPYLK